MTNDPHGEGSANGQAQLEPQTEAMLAVLTEAARDEDLWKVLLQEPKRYLSEKGIELPNNYQLTLNQAPVNRSAVPVAVECPPGLVYHSETKLENVCVKSIEGTITKQVTDPNTGQVITIYEQHIYACLEWKPQLITRSWCGLAVLFP